MKKRSIVMATMLVGAMTLPLGKDYANTNPDTLSIDDTLKKTSIVVGEVLSPREMIYLKYDSVAIDSVLTRKKYNLENFIDETLDTVSTYTDVVDKYFIKASIKQESMYNPKIKSYAGARGLLQLMPVAWKEFGEGKYINAYDPVKNIRAGLKYNLWLENYISKKNPNWDTLSIEDKRSQILAAYNGGITRLKKRNWDIARMPKESRNHAKIINNYIKEFQIENEIVSSYYYIKPESMKTSVAIYSR